MYNKIAIYKFKESHPLEYSQMTAKAAAKWRELNLLKSYESDRLRKTPFMTEWRAFRRIDIF